MEPFLWIIGYAVLGGVSVFVVALMDAWEGKEPDYNAFAAPVFILWPLLLGVGTAAGIGWLASRPFVRVVQAVKTHRASAIAEQRAIQRIADTL